MNPKQGKPEDKEETFDDELINAKIKDLKVKISEKDFAELSDKAEKIGMAVVKYFDLKQNRIGNYIFSYKKMLDPKGDSAVYLLYAYARICSILKKSGLTD